jgi:D-3-phosphoglycerate dehydrogenase
VLLRAKDAGIKISESKVEGGDFTTQLGLRVEDETGIHVIEAALAGGDAQIVNVDGFHVSIPTEGALILFFNKDLPGMIGKATTVLGEAGVNIASLANGRKEKGGEALTVISVDGAVDEGVVGKLGKIEGIKSARVIHL